MTIYIIKFLAVIISKVGYNVSWPLLSQNEGMRVRFVSVVRPNRYISQNSALTYCKISNKLKNKQIIGCLFDVWKQCDDVEFPLNKTRLREEHQQWEKIQKNSWPYWVNHKKRNSWQFSALTKFQIIDKQCFKTTLNVAIQLVLLNSTTFRQSLET